MRIGSYSQGKSQLRSVVQASVPAPITLFTPTKYFLPKKQSTSPQAEITGRFSPHVTALTHCPTIVHHHQISICNPSFLWVHKTGHKGNKTSKKTLGQAERWRPFCVSSPDAARQLCFPPEIHTVLVAFSGPYLHICKKLWIFATGCSFYISLYISQYRIRPTLIKPLIREHRAN